MPRPQFTLRALLVAMLAVGVAANWSALWRQSEQAKEHFEAVLAEYGAGHATYQDVRSALRRHYEADLAIPFANKEQANKSFRNWETIIGEIRRSMQQHDASP